MKQRFGALLCLALGGVLITSGLSTGSAGTVGVQPPPTCEGTGGLVSFPCPTGTIAITEKTVQATSGFAHAAVPHLAAAPTPPAGGWKVDITSTNCADPSGGPLAMTVTVPDGGTGTSGPLFVFSNPSHATYCSYALVEHAVAGFTATFDPASPVTIPFGKGQTNSGRKVKLTNTFAAPPTATPSPSTSGASSSAVTVTDDGLRPSVTPTGALANTGPREQVNTSLLIGIGLCLLGLILLFEGRVRRIGNHRD